MTVPAAPMSCCWQPGGEEECDWLYARLDAETTPSSASCAAAAAAAARTRWTAALAEAAVVPLAMATAHVQLQAAALLRRQRRASWCDARSGAAAGAAQPHQHKAAGAPHHGLDDLKAALDGGRAAVGAAQYRTGAGGAGAGVRAVLSRPRRHSTTECASECVGAAWAAHRSASVMWAPFVQRGSEFAWGC